MLLAQYASKTLFTFKIAYDKLEPEKKIENTKWRDIDNNNRATFGIVGRIGDSGLVTVTTTSEKGKLH